MSTEAGGVWNVYSWVLERGRSTRNAKNVRNSAKNLVKRNSLIRVNDKHRGNQKNGFSSKSTECAVASHRLQGISALNGGACRSPFSPLFTFSMVKIITIFVIYLLPSRFYRLVVPRSLFRSPHRNSIMCNHLIISWQIASIFEPENNLSLSRSTEMRVFMSLLFPPIQSLSIYWV